MTGLKMAKAAIIGPKSAAMTRPTTTGITTWSIDPAHSLVEFAVKHLMISTVKGRFGEY